MRERRTLTSAYSAATKKPFASTNNNTSASFTSTEVSEDSICRIIIAGRPLSRKQRLPRARVATHRAVSSQARCLRPLKRLPGFPIVSAVFEYRHAGAGVQLCSQSHISLLASRGFLSPRYANENRLHQTGADVFKDGHRHLSFR